MANIYNQFAGLISFTSYAMYVISILRGKTQPSRSTWWILTIIGALIFTSSYTMGAKHNMWIQLCYVVGPLIIALLSVKYGYGSRKLLPVDKTCIMGALVCMLIWVIFNSPLVVFMGSIVVDFIALIPTIRKSYYDTDSEDLLSWVVETVASLTNALGIAMWMNFSDASWIYALYLLTINGLITMLLIRNSRLRYKTYRTLAIQ
jgi:hypothetical protein